MFYTEGGAQTIATVASGSGNGKTFYKWSNDNGTYTELGGVVEGRASYSVFFSTDRSPEGGVAPSSSFTSLRDLITSSTKPYDFASSADM